MRRKKDSENSFSQSILYCNITLRTSFVQIHIDIVNYNLQVNRTDLK